MIPADDQEEAPAIAAVLAGQKQAFRILVERHQARIHRVCTQFLQDYARAEDLTQDTFVTAFRKLRQFDAGKGSFTVWLVTIARRLCLNAQKKCGPLPMASPPDIETAGAGPDTDATRSDTFRALDAAMAELSEDHRRVFLLTEIEELPLRDIAQMENVALGTIKSRLSRAASGGIKPTGKIAAGPAPAPKCPPEKPPSRQTTALSSATTALNPKTAATSVPSAMRPSTPTRWRPSGAVQENWNSQVAPRHRPLDRPIVF